MLNCKFLIIFSSIKSNIFYLNKANLFFWYMSKSSTYKEFFPYPSYRLEQEDIIPKIEKSARLKQNILLVAPNGTGKTIMALSALLPIALEQGLKIVYMCRTHTQSKRVIKELKKIHSSKGNKGVSGLSIRGRNEMCLNSTLLRLKARPTEAMAICKSLRSTNNCAYYRNLKKSTCSFKSIDLYLFDSPVDAQELIEFCKQKRYCPYFLSKRLLKEMPIIVTITDYYGNNPFVEGDPELLAHVKEDGTATIEIDDYYLEQLLPGVYSVNIYAYPNTYTKGAYRFVTLECRPENWMKFGEPTMRLDLLNWYDSGWGGAYFGDDYLFYEDIYPRLTGYLATLHSDEGIFFLLKIVFFKIDITGIYNKFFPFMVFV